jgi:predicted permease
MLTDLRHAVRTLRHAPGFSLVVVLTLGLGIGANTSIFSLMDQLLLRLLPVADPDELVQLDGPGPFSGRTMNDRTFSYPMYQDLRDRNDVFSGLLARAGFDATLIQQARSERVAVELVSGNFFDVLGVRAVLGRAISTSDDRVRATHPVVVLGHGFWMRRFAGDPQILDQTLTLNQTPMTVIGVAPPGFTGVTAFSSPDVFVPLAMKAQITPTWDDLDNRRSRWVTIIGRLRPDVSIETARARLDVTYKQVNAQELESVPAFAAASEAFRERFRAKAIAVEPAGKGLSGLRRGFSTPLAVLMGMVGLVLLIACANVASLLVARSGAAERDRSPARPRCQPRPHRPSDPHRKRAARGGRRRGWPRAVRVGQRAARRAAAER